jgi:tartronate-semialdehyde synthase
LKAAEAVVRILEDEGVRDIFGIPGAGINPVYKYLGETKKITHYTVRHEEAAVSSGFESVTIAQAACSA